MSSGAAKMSEAEEEAARYQARITRRLEGSYERLSKLLSETVSENQHSLLRLNSIRVEGSANTRSTFLNRVCGPFLRPRPGQLNSTYTLQELLGVSRHIADTLERFDIYSDVQATLEDSPSIFAEQGDVDLLINVKEASRFHAKMATDVGNNEGNATLTARIRNVFGGAELFEANFSSGTRTKFNYSAKLESPLCADPDWRGQLQAYAAERDLSLWASCREESTGASVGLSTISPWGLHQFNYDIVARRLHQFETHASLSMRQSGGSNLKSAVSHTFTGLLGGAQVRLQQEFAGLGGDARHLKLEADASWIKLLPADYMFTCGVRSGFILPFGRPTALFSDRFQLGGPTSVRSFKINSLGPKDNADSLGGDLSYALGASLITPFPFKPQWPVNGHLFLNAGSLEQWRTDRPASQTLSSWISRPSVSAGIGVLYRRGAIRVEGNLGVPLVARKLDGQRKGLQLGIGVSFL